MNIPTSLIVVGLVVAWLVVLVPMVARRRERVPQAPASGAGMRVLRRASASLRRKPRRARSARPTQGRDRQSGRTEEVLVSVGAGPQHEPTDAAEEWAAAQAESRRPVATMTPPAHDEPQLSFTDEDRGLDDIGADADGSAGNGRGGDGSTFAEFQADAESTVAVGISGADGTDADGTDADGADADGADTDGGRPVDRGTIADEVDEDEWAMEAAAAPTVPPVRPDGVEGRASPPGAPPARSRRLRPRGRGGDPCLPVPATSADHLRAADRDRRLHPCRAADGLGVLGGCGRLGCPAGRIPRLSASAGADRGGDPSAPDGATATCAADPSRVRTITAGSGSFGCRSRAGGRRPGRRRSGVRRSRAVPRACDLPACRRAVIPAVRIPGVRSGADHCSSGRTDRRSRAS